MALTKKEKVMLYHSLPASKKAAFKKYCCSKAMKGEGFGSFLKKAGHFLGPIAKVIGPVILKEIVIPLIRKKMAGTGLKLAGKGRIVKRK
jgi:hypothetical protein